ncbi:MAG TPA: PH domain-containing protein [Gemmatimonadaceae bacterium]|nr:PH domain-containing protein [Gemmatimonadaceae bacterium]
MGYVDDNLVTGEKIVHRARLHWLAYSGAVGLALLTVAFLILRWITGEDGFLFAAGFSLLVTIVVWLVTYVKHASSEFAVTNKRVLMKEGLVRRRTFETMLSKVEGVDVEQTFWGRMLGFGTVTVTGTGGSTETYKKIAAPLELRRQVQMQLMELEEQRSTADYPPAPGPPRDERECPWCAERILVKAKVCKHCGRDVA